MANFSMLPVTEDGSYFWPESEHALLGLSPWNSRYTPRYIEALLGWAAENFAAVDVFVPGYEAALTLTAAGITPGKAVHLARRAINQLRNPAVRALRSAGVMCPEQRVRSWTQLCAVPAYSAMLRRAKHAYVVDPAIRSACRSIAEAKVRGMVDWAPDERQIDQASSYAVAEIPLLLDSPGVFGVSSSTFIYHREMDLVHPFVAGTAVTLRPVPGQGFAIAKLEGKTDDER